MPIFKHIIICIMLLTFWLKYFKLSRKGFTITFLKRMYVHTYIIDQFEAITEKMLVTHLMVSSIAGLWPRCHDQSDTNENKLLLHVIYYDLELFIMSLYWYKRWPTLAIDTGTRMSLNNLYRCEIAIGNRSLWIESRSVINHTYQRLLHHWSNSHYAIVYILSYDSRNVFSTQWNNA